MKQFNKASECAVHMYRRVPSSSNVDWIVLDWTSDLHDFFYHEHKHRMIIICNNTDHLNIVYRNIAVASISNQANNVDFYRVLKVEGGDEYNKDTFPFSTLLDYVSKIENDVKIKKFK